MRRRRVEDHARFKRYKGKKASLAAFRCDFVFGVSHLWLLRLFQKQNAFLRYRDELKQANLAMSSGKPCFGPKGGLTLWRQVRSKC